MNPNPDKHESDELLKREPATDDASLNHFICPQSLAVELVFQLRPHRAQYTRPPRRVNARRWDPVLYSGPEPVGPA